MLRRLLFHSSLFQVDSARRADQLRHTNKFRDKGPPGRRLPDKKKQVKAVNSASQKESNHRAMINKIFPQINKSDKLDKLDNGEFDKILFFRVPTLLRLRAKRTKCQTSVCENNNTRTLSGVDIEDIGTVNGSRHRTVQTEKKNVCKMCHIL